MHNLFAGRILLKAYFLWLEWIFIKRSVEWHGCRRRCIEEKGKDMLVDVLASGKSPPYIFSIYVKTQTEICRLTNIVL